MIPAPSHIKYYSMLHLSYIGCPGKIPSYRVCLHDIADVVHDILCMNDAA